MLETLSWIAAIIAVPVAIIGWFTSGARETDKSVASEGATAISGDMHLKEAGIVAGYNSAVNVSLTVNTDTQHADRYETCYAIFQDVGRALNEVLCEKMISPGTFESFSRAVTDSRFLLGDDGLVAYLRACCISERGAWAGREIPSHHDLNGSLAGRRPESSRFPSSRRTASMAD
jgi:hypothetical protein